ncbi:hypothetical protein E2C01_087632 [Portunus trituberculatus]|uniref:Uncharacterized protein n=1 Tax=Portunus trituberculatus TaxID=210409 RepID=A0A5B7JC79_PORTR|nr:hypothetical protein [Portunus trituberculatus]
MLVLLIPPPMSPCIP